MIFSCTQRTSTFNHSLASKNTWRLISKIKSGMSNYRFMQTCPQAIWSTRGASMLQRYKKLQSWCQTTMSLQKITKGIKLSLCALLFRSKQQPTIQCAVSCSLLTDTSRSIIEGMQAMSMVAFTLYLISTGRTILYNIRWSFLMAKMDGTATCRTLLSSISTTN